MQRSGSPVHGRLERVGRFFLLLELPLKCVDNLDGIFRIGVGTDPVPSLWHGRSGVPFLPIPVVVPL